MSLSTISSSIHTCPTPTCGDIQEDNSYTSSPSSLSNCTSAIHREDNSRNPSPRSLRNRTNDVHREDNHNSSPRLRSRSRSRSWADHTSDALQEDDYPETTIPLSRFTRAVNSLRQQLDKRTTENEAFRHENEALKRHMGVMHYQLDNLNDNNEKRKRHIAHLQLDLQVLTSQSRQHKEYHDSRVAGFMRGGYRGRGRGRS
jgi:regulator of replication initiation timing